MMNVLRGYCCRGSSRLIMQQTNILQPLIISKSFTRTQQPFISIIRRNFCSSLPISSTSTPTNVSSSAQKLSSSSSLDAVALFSNIKKASQSSQNTFVSKVTDEEYQKYLENFNTRAKEQLELVDFSDLSLFSSKNGFNFFIAKNKEEDSRFSVGILKDKDGNEIAKIARNYAMMESWVEKDGETYFVTAEDYQGITVVNCNKKWKENYIPRDAVRGLGFCFASATLSPNGKYLAVDGCIWACPYETRFFDFSNPRQFPYKEIARIPFEDPYTSEWGDDCYKYSVELDKLTSYCNGITTFKMEKSIKKYEDAEVEFKQLSEEEKQKFIDKEILEEWESIKDSIEYSMGDVEVKANKETNVLDITINLK